MQALFVHGMGRSPISAIPFLWRLKSRGVAPSTFFYSVTFETFDVIQARLCETILGVAARGEYVLVGHSLGGVLIRSALASLPASTPLPNRVFLLGSPVMPSRIARAVRHNWLFRLVTRDCGQLLSSEERMQKIAPCNVPTTSIVGTRGLYGRFSPFGDEPNDGVVASSEVGAAWITEEIRIPATHWFMPANKKIWQLVIERM
jgi:pimeloyl-ACP methyl ester carboxylesterase